jgi:hypothetical protein
MTTITREQLALLLESERHPHMAERIRADCDPVMVLGDGKGGLRQALRRSRYDDKQAQDTQATLAAVVSGEITVTSGES